ncbi:hypothetical protein C4H11_11475 [Bacteroides zoogleoformans]|uniref:Uncharacterized protein n=1 Tax=Bacteroides zoogleoformans TaxID=28119 RepID=A0ABM6TA09_9BACE|nr:hypothetical protein C4H11_11475 [Bacteroides zoogleoformans]
MGCDSRFDVEGRIAHVDSFEIAGGESGESVAGTHSFGTDVQTGCVVLHDETAEPLVIGRAVTLLLLLWLLLALLLRLLLLLLWLLLFLLLCFLLALLLRLLILLLRFQLVKCNHLLCRD